MTQRGYFMRCVRLAGKALVMALVLPAVSWAEQVEMQNGDRYVGKVVAVDGETVVLQNDVLGTLRLPRSKVASITLGGEAAPKSAPQAAPANGATGAGAAAATNAAPDVPAGLREIGKHTNLIRQVQKKYLGDAGPEAQQKFEELLGGLISGKITVEDLRAQAKAAADQLRQLKQQGGEDAGLALDTYLAILDHFVNETAAVGSATNKPAAPKPPKN
jgi:hypothetical protein